MAQAEVAFILALALHHGYWVNLRESKDLRDIFPTVKKGMTLDLYTAKGEFRKHLKVMEKNDRPYSIKVMDDDGDNPVQRGDILKWER